MSPTLPWLVACAKADGGSRCAGLTLVNGSHQFHDGHLSLRWGDFDPPIEGSSNFDDWSREVGGVHPQTGEPLKFETISVEPGSICAVAFIFLWKLIWVA